MSLPVDAAFAPDLSALLAPLPGADPTGESLRYAPVYAQIRDARFEEDQNLPMGEWTRPLKRADWQAMADRLRAAGTAFVIEPQLRFAGQPGEQWTMFFRDPFGNPIEIKGFEDLASVYAA